MRPSKRKEDAPSSWRRRFAGACAVLGVLLAGVFAVEFAYDALKERGSASEPSPKGMESAAPLQDACAVPVWFSEEVLDATAYADVRCGADGAVVGFTVQGFSREVFGRLAVELQEKGWVQVESGIEHAGTFIKENGHCRWLLLSCVQVGEIVSVVVQSAAEGA